MGVVLGGGGCNVFLIFYAIYNISRKNNFGNKIFFFFLRKTIISHLMFSSCFFYAGNFNMRLEILKSAPSLTG